MSLFTIPVVGKYKITYGWVPGVHRSVDFAVPVGTTVVAAEAGTVESAGNYGAMGDTIRIKHAGGYETLYGNLGTFKVSVGQGVSAGQAIGTSDGRINSVHPGDSTGPHTPFQVWLNGKPVDPAPLLGVSVGSTGTGSVQEAAAINPLDPLAGLNQAGQSLGTIGSWLGNSGNWVRVGLGALGATFLLIAVIKLLDATKAGQAVNSLVGTAAKSAVTATKVAIAVPK